MVSSSGCARNSHKGVGRQLLSGSKGHMSSEDRKLFHTKGALGHINLELALRNAASIHADLIGVSLRVDPLALVALLPAESPPSRLPRPPHVS